MPEQNRCEQCNQQFQNAEELQQHNQQQHNQQPGQQQAQQGNQPQQGAR
jgi:hypothetical protein